MGAAGSLLTRRPLVVANWKMYLGRAESVRAARMIRRRLASLVRRRVDVVLCPSFPSLHAVREVLVGGPLHLGAQDVHGEEAGAYTGDVSVHQLQGLARYVIVGHSERRRFHGEADAEIARKLRRALRAGLHPILCVGETAEEREAGLAVARVRRQVEEALSGVPALSLARLIIAYEPIWAISQGRGQPRPQPLPAEAGEMLGLIRKVVADEFGRRHAERLRLLYGGSVEARTVRPFLTEPAVDGVLVGGASANPAELVAIVRAVIACRS